MSEVGWWHSAHVLKYVCVGVPLWVCLCVCVRLFCWAAVWIHTTGRWSRPGEVRRGSTVHNSSFQYSMCGCGSMFMQLSSASPSSCIALMTKWLWDLGKIKLLWLSRLSIIPHPYSQLHSSKPFVCAQDMLVILRINSWYSKLCVCCGWCWSLLYSAVLCSGADLLCSLSHVVLNERL